MGEHNVRRFLCCPVVQCLHGCLCNPPPSLLGYGVIMSKRVSDVARSIKDRMPCRFHHVQRSSKSSRAGESPRPSGSHVWQLRCHTVEGRHGAPALTDNPAVHPGTRGTVPEHMLRQFAGGTSTIYMLEALAAMIAPVVFKQKQCR